MTDQRKKFKKKKEREQRVKVKLARRREALRKDKELQDAERAKERAAYILEHGVPRPIVTNPAKLAEMEARKARSVADRLKKNLELLEALEKEYEDEQANREKVNENLEAEGYMTMKEKMDALHKKALELTGKAEELAKAQEEYAAQQKETTEPIIDVNS
jgi:hypothetical protein